MARSKTGRGGPRSGGPGVQPGPGEATPNPEGGPPLFCAEQAKRAEVETRVGDGVPAPSVSAATRVPKCPEGGSLDLSAGASLQEHARKPGGRACARPVKRSAERSGGKGSVCMPGVQPGKGRGAALAASRGAAAEPVHTGTRRGAQRPEACRQSLHSPSGRPFESTNSYTVHVIAKGASNATI